DRQQLFNEWIGQSGRAGGLAEHRGGQQVVGRRSDVELERTEFTQGGTRRVPNSVVGLGAQRRRWPAKPDEPLGGDGGEVANVLWQIGFHRCSPNTSRATSMRCTSMVPDATVAACA